MLAGLMSRCSSLWVCTSRSPLSRCMNTWRTSRSDTWSCRIWICCCSVRPAFLEEAFHAVTERGQVLGGAGAHDIAFGPQDQRRGQIFLDCDRPAAVVERPVDDRKPAAADLAIDAVVQQLVAG